MTPLSAALCDGGVATVLDQDESIDVTEFGAVTNDSAFAEQMRRSAMDLGRTHHWTVRRGSFAADSSGKVVKDPMYVPERGVP